MSSWTSANWRTGQEHDFRIEAIARPGLSRAGSYAKNPRVFKDGVAYRPTGVIIQGHQTGRHVLLEFGGKSGTLIAIEPTSELIVVRDEARLVDVAFRGRVADVTIEGGALPVPEDEEEAAPTREPEPLPSFDELREAMAR